VALGAEMSMSSVEIESITVLLLTRRDVFDPDPANPDLLVLLHSRRSFPTFPGKHVGGSFYEIVANAVVPALFLFLFGGLMKAEGASREIESALDIRVPPVESRRRRSLGAADGGVLGTGITRSATARSIARLLSHSSCRGTSWKGIMEGSSAILRFIFKRPSRFA